jgi:copper homeostasis protein (lipoprotein)
MRRCAALMLLALEWTACASPRPGAREVGTAPRALTGMFTYMADAAVIVLCGQREPMPVAMEAAFKALQAAYLKERPQPGQAILVSLEGRVEPRPSPEESLPPRPSLIVDRFVGIWPGETCGNPRIESPLRNTRWKLVRLSGAPVRVAPRQRDVYLILAPDEPRVSGDGGCNRFTGGFELDGDRLRFRSMAGTMMACLDGMEQEGYFMQALQKGRALPHPR